MTISMLRGEPRNTSTISATSTAAMTASCTTSHSAARTNVRLVEGERDLQPLGRGREDVAESRALTASTTVSVEASACLITIR